MNCRPLLTTPYCALAVKPVTYTLETALGSVKLSDPAPALLYFLAKTAARLLPRTAPWRLPAPSESTLPENSEVALAAVLGLVAYWRRSTSVINRLCHPSRLITNLIKRMRQATCTQEFSPYNDKSASQPQLCKHALKRDERRHIYQTVRGRGYTLAVRAAIAYRQVARNPQRSYATLPSRSRPGCPTLAQLQANEHNYFLFTLIAVNLKRGTKYLETMHIFEYAQYSMFG